MAIADYTNEEYEDLDIFESDEYNRISRLENFYIANIAKHDPDIEKMGTFIGMLSYIGQKNRVYCSKRNINRLDATWHIYVNLCYKYDRQPTVQGFSQVTGISQRDYSAFKNPIRERDKYITSRHRMFYQNWLNECENWLLNGSVDSRNPTGYIFQLNTNYGYVQKSEQVQRIDQVCSTERKSLEELQEEYKIPNVGRKQRPKLEIDDD